MKSGAHKVFDDRVEQGYDSKPWRWNGYDGQTTDGITVAERDDGTIVRLSGEVAQKNWQNIVCWADNISRIDVMVTICDDGQNFSRALHADTQSMGNNMVQSGITKTSLHLNRPAGSTFTIGSRSSARYMRLYDKTAESLGEYPETSWRYEVEYKSDRAHRLARKLAASNHPPDTALGIVKEAFGSYGVNVPVPSVPIGWRDAGIRHVTDDERRLAWLKKCIRPSVLKLAEAYSADTIAEALGLYGIIDEVTGYISSWSDVDLADGDT